MPFANDTGVHVRFPPIADVGWIVESPGMPMWKVLLLGVMVVSSSLSSAAPTGSVPVPTKRQLRGLTADEAATLVAKLEDAQRQLRAGKFQPFELIAGSIASYPATKVSPRDAFLQVQFGKVWEIQRGATDNRLWQPYKLAYSPNGLGQLYWDIEVVLGFYGNLERVLMVYKPPAPF